MKLEVFGQHVLLVGCNPSTVSVITRLLAESARVSICAPTLPVAVEDLVNRGLIQSVSEPNLNDYDLVLRQVPRSVAGPKGESEPSGATGSISSVEPTISAERTSPSGNPESATPDRVIGGVTLVGGGPGSPDLITVAGLDALRTADVIVYDRLAPLPCLEVARAGAELIDVGKIPRGHHADQEAINELLIAKAQTGANVVRFKGGDNFVFGRGGEEALALAAAGVAVRVIPGVSSSLAAPALAGIPVTHRGLTQGVTVISGHLGPDHPQSTLNWEALATSTTTLVVLMGVAALPQIVSGLIDRGMDAGRPAAVIADASLPSMRVVRGTLAELPQLVTAAKIMPPAITVIGEVAALDLR